MSSFLDSLGIASGPSKEVYIAVSSSNKIEMATIDPKSNTIQSYAQTNLEYNESLREITSYEDFKTKVESLFRHCNVSPQKTNVHLSIPTVWFGYKDNIPPILDDYAITNVVLGELEQTYIFKRKDPIPFWFDALNSNSPESRNIFYTAIQADVKDNLQNIFKELGANLISIDCSIFSDLRGLNSTDIASAQMEFSEEPWSLLIVNNAGFQLYGMQNKKITEFNEEPIAIKSYEGDEIYSAIDNAAQVPLLSSSSATLVILSETDLVSAELLANRIQFNGNIIVVEDNQYKKEPFIENPNIIKENQFQVSLHILGLISPRENYPVDLNFLATGDTKPKNDTIEIPLGNGQVITLTPLKATIIAAIILAVALIPLGLLTITSAILKTNFTNKKDQVKTQLEQVNTQIKQYENKKEDKTFNEEQAIETTLKNNRKKIMSYTALGESIPKELYLTYFMTGDSGYVDIQGCANSVEDVYVFFQNLKDALIESKLRLSKLDLKTGSLESVINSMSSTVDDAPYIFEITNMDDGQIQSFMNTINNSVSGITKNSAEPEQPGKQGPEQAEPPKPVN